MCATLVHNRGDSGFEIKLHFLVAYCWENFLMVCTIFFPVFENFQPLTASFFMDPQKLPIDLKI